MSTTKIVDSMRDVTTVDAAKITGTLPAISGTNLTNLDATDLAGAVPSTSLANVNLVEGTKGADIASAGTMTIGTDGSYFDITGTTGISTMTVAAGRVFTLQFDGAVTLTHSSTLYLSGAADFTTEANDHMTFISVAANDVRQIGTGLKDGGSPVAAAGGVDGISSSANADAIVISADEEVTMPKQPCFNAHLTSTTSSVTGDTTSYTVTFPAELFDLNADFASNTFTAPVTGKYLLNFNHYTYGITSSISHYNFIFDTSNRNYRGFHSNTSAWGPSDISFGGSVVADMDASDTAHITIQANGAGKIINVYGDTTGNVYTWFSGCLLA